MFVNLKSFSKLEKSSMEYLSLELLLLNNSDKKEMNSKYVKSK